MTSVGSHIYLVKASDRLVSHCRCAGGPITFPPQMDCPWCGCGWLFTCIGCRKAFTFAKGVILNEPWQETASRDLRGRLKKQPTGEEIEEWVGAMKELLADVEEGSEYVCLDGLIIPTSNQAVRFRGWHARHDLPYVPQVAALSDQSVMRTVLGNPKYWEANALGTDEQ